MYKLDLGKAEIKICLLLGRKAMTKLDSVLKGRDITLPTKAYIVKAMVFPVVMYGCELNYKESWAPKNWCFWTVVLDKSLERRRSNQSILKEINPEYSLEGLMMKLKLQYFGHLMWRADSLEKTLMLGMIEGWRRRDDRGWDGWMASPSQWSCVCVNSGGWWCTGRPGVLPLVGSPRVEDNRATALNWTESLSTAPTLCFAGLKLAVLTLHIKVTENHVCRETQTKCILNQIPRTNPPNACDHSTPPKMSRNCSRSTNLTLY